MIKLRNPETGDVAEFPSDRSANVFRRKGWTEADADTPAAGQPGTDGEGDGLDELDRAELYERAKGIDGVTSRSSKDDLIAALRGTSTED